MVHQSSQDPGGPPPSNPIQEIWLNRIAAAPDAWRARASAAAGFLAAATAATVVALVLQEPHTAPWWARIALLVAAVSYVFAVILYLLAAVWPSPKQDTREVLDYANAIVDYCNSEAKPIKRAVKIGTTFAVIAIVATAASFLLLLQPPSHQVMIALNDDQIMQSYRDICPDLQTPFPAQINSYGERTLQLRIPATACGDNSATAVAPYGSITVFLPQD